MASADCGVTIACPVEDVFAVLTNPTLSPRWSPNAINTVARSCTCRV